jgi:hypothetical protein
MSDWAMPGMFFWPSARVGRPGIARRRALNRAHEAGERAVFAPTTSRPVRAALA